MSSKRKNTPTKLPSASDVTNSASDGMLADVDMYGVVTNRGDSCQSDGDSNHSDNNDDGAAGFSDSDSLSVDMRTTSPKRSRQDSESSSAPHSPHYKKQRLLQSVNNNDDLTPTGSPQMQDLENDFRQEIITTNNNNVILSGSKSPNNNSIQRKSMHNVLQKLNHGKVDENGGTNHPAPGSEDALLSSLQLQLMSEGESVEEKQRRINEMIAQLQKVKDTLHATAQPNSTPSVSNSFHKFSCD